MRWPDARRRVAVAAAVLVPAVLLALSTAVIAAEPTPTAAAGGDPRSVGEGPGLVGDPAWAIGIVVAIAVLSLVVTLAYVRFTTHRRGEPRD